MCNWLFPTCRLVLTLTCVVSTSPARIAARGAPGSLVRVVGAGSRGNNEPEDVGQEEEHWVYITYIDIDVLMNQLTRGYMKLHLRPGHDLSEDVTADMIVYYDYSADVAFVEVAVVVEPDDDGDLQPSALPPRRRPAADVEPAAASADSGDESDFEDWCERNVK